MKPRLPIATTPAWTHAVSRAGGQCETNTETVDARCGARLDMGDPLFLGPDGVLRCDSCTKKVERARADAKRAHARAELAAAQESLF